MMAQKDTNPYRFSDSNKRYQTYEYRLRQKFGKKVAKIPLDAGFSCPNIDKNGLGCIYCSSRGSGDFIPPGMTLREQYDAGRLALGEPFDRVDGGLSVGGGKRKGEKAFTSGENCGIVCKTESRN